MSFCIHFGWSGPAAPLLFRLKVKESWLPGMERSHSRLTCLTSPGRSVIQLLGVMVTVHQTFLHKIEKYYIVVVPLWRECRNKNTTSCRLTCIIQSPRQFLPGTVLIQYTKKTTCFIKATTLASRIGGVESAEVRLALDRVVHPSHAGDVVAIVIRNHPHPALPDGPAGGGGQHQADADHQLNLKSQLVIFKCGFQISRLGREIDIRTMRAKMFIACQRLVD